MLQQARGQPDGASGAQAPGLTGYNRAPKSAEGLAQKNRGPIDSEDLPQEQQKLAKHRVSAQGMGKNAGKIAQNFKGFMRVGCLSGRIDVPRLTVPKRKRTGNGRDGHDG